MPRPFVSDQAAVALKVANSSLPCLLLFFLHLTPTSLHHTTHRHPQAWLSNFTHSVAPRRHYSYQRNNNPLHSPTPLRVSLTRTSEPKPSPAQLPFAPNNHFPVRLHVVHHGFSTNMASLTSFSSLTAATTVVPNRIRPTSSGLCPVRSAGRGLKAPTSTERSSAWAFV